MRILIVAAVAAIAAVVAVLVLDKFDGPWRGDTSISTAIAGAIAGMVGVFVARKLRKESGG